MYQLRPSLSDKIVPNTPQAQPRSSREGNSAEQPLCVQRGGSGVARNKPHTLRHQQRQENITATQRGCQAAGGRGFCSIFRAVSPSERQTRDQPCQPGAEPHGALKASVTEGCSSLTQAHPTATGLFKLSNARTRFSGRLSSPPFYQRHRSQQRSC